jgi:reactive intermediate/imine deaminase
MNKRTVLSTPHAPAAIGPYSQAIRSGDLLFASGQLGLDPATGNLVEGIEAQTRQALTNLQAVLATAGGSVANVVKTTIFLADMAILPRSTRCMRRSFATSRRRAAPCRWRHCPKAAWSRSKSSPGWTSRLDVFLFKNAAQLPDSIHWCTFRRTATI